MINNVVLVGRLTKEVDLRKTQSGASVVSFTLAVNRAIKQEGQPDADFVQCVAWNKTADNMAQYLHKGSLIGVEGRIQTRSYDSPQGQRVYVTEVIVSSVQFLEPRSTSESQSVQTQANTYQGNYNAQTSVQIGREPQYAGSLTQAAVAGEWGSDEPLDLASDDLPF